MGFANWAADPDPHRNFTGKRVFPHASTSGGRALCEPTIMTDSAAYLARRHAHVSASDAEDHALVYRRHLGAAPLPNLEPKPDRKRFLPEPQGQMPRVHGLKKSAVPGENGGEVPTPNLPQLRKVQGRYITYSNHKEQNLEDLLCHRRHVQPSNFFGRGYAGDLSKRSGPPPRIEITESLFKGDVENPTFTRFVNSLKPPTAGQTCTDRRELQVQRKVVEEILHARNEVVNLERWGGGRGDAE